MDNAAANCDQDMIEAERRLSAAYEVRPVPRALRAAKIAAAATIPLALLALSASTEDGQQVSMTLVWLILLTFVGAVWYSRRVWHRDTVTVLSAKRYRIKPRFVLARVGWGSLVLAVALILVDYSQRNDQERVITAYVLPSAAYGLYLVLLFWPQYSVVLTPAAKDESARLKLAAETAAWNKAGKPQEPSWISNLAAELWTRWYTRYAVGALLIWLSITLFSDAGRDAWIVGLTVLAAGLWCMREVALWAIGLAIAGGLLYLAVGAIAGIPVSVAIIIGALIIANSRKD